MISFLKNIISTTIALILTIIILIAVIVFLSTNTINDKTIATTKPNSILIDRTTQTNLDLQLGERIKIQK